MPDFRPKWEWRSGDAATTQIGFTNTHGQRCAGHRGVRGTDHLQYAYKVECTVCGYVYGANGSDLHERLCPECQSGAPGIPYWQLPSAGRHSKEQWALSCLPGVSTGLFRLVDLDEGGVAGSPDNLRLVCLLHGGGKLAIWGQAGSRNNIDIVLKAGIPCTVRMRLPPAQSDSGLEVRTHAMGPGGLSPARGIATVIVSNNGIGYHRRLQPTAANDIPTAAAETQT